VALPTLDECKALLRLETTAEDAFLTPLLADVTGVVAAYLNRPITGVARTYTDDAETLRAYGRVTRLHVPVYPIAASGDDAPVVTDADDVTVDATTYRVDGDAGSFTGKPDTTFDNGPYRLTVKVGLDQGTEYATQVEPVLRRAILDTVATYYAQRVASVKQSSTAGAQETHDVDPETGLPPRVMGALRHLRLVRVA
jgi:hypothetical protein